MKDSELGRRDFFKVGAGAAATIGMLNVVTASAQGGPSSQGVLWWAARPGKGGVGKPASIDLHSHWSPQP